MNLVRVRDKLPPSQLNAEASTSIKQLFFFAVSHQKLQSQDFTAHVLCHYQRAPIKPTLGNLIAM